MVLRGLNMRLKIDLYKENFTVPIGYNHILQGTIYNMLNSEEEGVFTTMKVIDWMKKYIKCSSLVTCLEAIRL